MFICLILALLSVRRNVVVVEEVGGQFTEGYAGCTAAPLDAFWVVVFYYDNEFWVVDRGEACDGCDRGADSGQGYAVLVGL